MNPNLVGILGLLVAVTSFVYSVYASQPKPQDDPYIALRDVTSALLPNNPASYQGSGEFKPSDSMIIPLEDKL